MGTFKSYKTAEHATRKFVKLYCRSLGGGWFKTPFRGRPIQGLIVIERILHNYGIIEECDANGEATGSTKPSRHNRHLLNTDRFINKGYGHWWGKVREDLI